MNVEIENLDVVITELTQTYEDFEQSVDQIIQKAGMAGRDEAVGIVPVLTGHLQGSITYDAPGLLMSEFFTDVYYSQFVEFGTRKMAAEPYMIPAYEAAKEQLLKDIQAL